MSAFHFNFRKRVRGGKIVAYIPPPLLGVNYHDTDGPHLTNQKIIIELKRKARSFISTILFSGLLLYPWVGLLPPKFKSTPWGHRRAILSLNRMVGLIDVLLFLVIIQRALLGPWFGFSGGGGLLLGHGLPVGMGDGRFMGGLIIH